MINRLHVCLSALGLIAAACSGGPVEIPRDTDTGRFNGVAEGEGEGEAALECVKGLSVQYFETFEGLAGDDLADAEASCFGFLIPADLGTNTPYDSFCEPGWVPFAQAGCGCGCIDENGEFQGGEPVDNCQGAPGDPEVCDGFDNDCDGLVDEDGPGDAELCDTGDDGECADGITACIGGDLLCIQTTESEPEVCDGLDNDCDGTADNGDPGGGADCDTGRLGVCADGTQSCVDGAVQCVQGSGQGAETCNSLDDDCDGAVDEEATDAGGACDTGLSGLCGQGEEQCVDGALECGQVTFPVAAWLIG